MKHREIGHTGMVVSELSFGASSLGGVFREIDENKAIDAVYAAVDGGRILLTYRLITDITRLRPYSERLFAE